MVYRNGKLVEATVDELLELYLNDSMDRAMDFDQYLLIVENNGCTINGSAANETCKACMINGVEGEFDDGGNE